MIEETALDRAHAAMQAAPESDAARLGFYERLADSELFLMLAEDPSVSDDQVTPEIFELNDASYVLVFDREERMAAFSGRSCSSNSSAICATVSGLPAASRAPSRICTRPVSDILFRPCLDVDGTERVSLYNFHQ